MKRKKQFIGILLSVSLLASSILPAAAFEKPANAEEVLQDGYASTQDAYAIYPVPQHTAYTAGSFELGKDVQVVAEPGIDQYTEDFLSEILEDYGRTEKESQTVAESQQILLGINGSNGVVDTWADSHVQLADSELFTKTDSYVLSARDGTIMILGKDTDAVYYGLATLQMMFSSFNGEKFLNAQIEDYAVMKTRGFIEGFYGGWNYEGRESLMRFARDVKMNTYIYASKTDSYHKNDVLYPAEDIAKIAELVEVGKETKVQYGWSVHISYFFNRLKDMTVGSDDYNAAFEQNFTKLVAKFQQLYDAGVRKFAILNDDFGAGSHSEVVRFLNKLDNEFLVPKKCENLTYCMQGYNRAWSGNGAELEVLKGLNDSIDLFWTGDDVNSPITQDTVNFLREKTNHEPVFWLNYPVNEHGPSGVYLGNITHYARDGVTGLAGAVSNPSRFTEANKVGLYQLGCLFWNNNNYLEKANTIWEEAFKYLQPEVYDAYLTIARNVSNCPGSGRVPAGFPESEYLKDTLDKVTEAINSGATLEGDADVTALMTEFKHMTDAVTEFRGSCANTELVAELDPWLKSLNDVATAGRKVLEALIALEKGDVMGGWDAFSIAGKAMDTQDTYPTYQGSDNKAKAGSKYLVPFVKRAVAVAKDMLAPYMGSGSAEPNPVFYGMFGGNAVEAGAESTKAMDGNLSTYGSFQTDQKLNDYFGIDFGTPVLVKNVTFVQGKDDTHHDIFHFFSLEYSEDGNTWTNVEDYTEAGSIYKIEKVLNVKARYVRVRLTQLGGTFDGSHKNNFWTYVREVSADWEEIPTYEAIGSTTEQTGSVSVEDKTYALTLTGDVSLAPGEYAGIRLEELAQLTSVVCQGSGTDALTLEYSENGAVWQTVPAQLNGELARYVRLVNRTESTQSITLSKFEATVAEAQMRPSLSVSGFSGLQGSWRDLFDGDTSTTVQTTDAQSKDDYILVDLGVTTAIHDLQITTTDDKPFQNAKIQVSVDQNTWEDIATVTNKGGDAVRDNIFYRITKNLNGKEVRYLKLLITADAQEALQLCNIDINRTAEKVNHAITGNVTGDLEKIIDGSISTVFAAEEVSDGTAYIEYKLTENTKIDSVIFLQDGAAITNARVTAQVYDGEKIETVSLGELDMASRQFGLDVSKDVLSFKVTWPSGTTPVLYEIITTTPQEQNLKSICTVTESGSGLQKVEYAVDDDTNTRWEGNAIKGGAATTTSWIQADMGEGRNVSVSRMTVSFYLKTYATDYDVQQSEDGQAWETLATLTNENGDTRDLLNTITLEKPAVKRYIRLFFRSMNANAAGHAVGIREWDIYGTTDREILEPAAATEEQIAQLQGMIQTLKSSIKEASAYPEDSYQAYAQALAAAEMILKGSQPKATPLQNALENLDTAAKPLKDLDAAADAQKEALRELISGLAGSIKDASAYTEDSYQAYVTALAAANAALTQGNLKAADIEKVKMDLDAAVRALKPADPTNQDPGNQDPGNQDPGNQDPGNQDPGNQDPGNQDPNNQKPSDKDPSKPTPQPEQPGNNTPAPIPGKVYEKNKVNYKVTSVSGQTVEAVNTTNNKLTSVKIPDQVNIEGKNYKVTSIAASAFKNHKKLRSVTIGKNVTVIGANAFANCTSLKKVTVNSKSLKQIDGKAFSGCKKLTSVRIKSTSLKKVGKSAFKGISKKAVIKVPAAKLKVYKKLLAKKGQSKTVKITK